MANTIYKEKQRLSISFDIRSEPSPELVEGLSKDEPCRPVQGGCDHGPFIAASDVIRAVPPVNPFAAAFTTIVPGWHVD